MIQILKSGALYCALVFGAGVVLWLRGLTIAEYFASRDPVAGTVYTVMLVVFAVMPLLAATGGERSSMVE